MENTNTCASLYAKLESSRQPFLDRARECSELTIPALIPKSGHNGVSKLTTPWQGIGARGVNNLASKLLLALLPPNTPFFRLAIDDFTLTKLTQQEGMRAKVEEGLNKIERSVMAEIEGSALRVGGFEALKHLLVSGNVLMYLPKEGGVRVFHLDRFVTRRDPMGNVLDIITKESVSPLMLPEEVRTAALGEGDQPLNTEKNVDLFTHVYRDEKKWRVYQEVKGMRVPGSEGDYPIDKTPWIPVRFSKIDGEDYGRGYVEEYLGDLKSLEGLTQAIVEGSAAAAKLVFLVNPNGTTDKADLAACENGAFVDGNVQDVNVLQLQKFNDFRVAHDTITGITERLSYAFMLNSAVQRSGDRVTAEEIRYMAGELEDGLGGIYSILSQELQLPLVKRLMFQMERQKRLPVLPDGTIQPVIVTGMEALGRGHDLNKLNLFLQNLSPLGPEVLARYMNVSDYVTRVGTSLGIDMSGLIKTEEQVQAEQQQAMQQQMMQQMAVPGMQEASAMIQQGMANGNQ